MGFPTNYEVDVFLKGLTHVLCAENPFSFYLLKRAEQLGIKVYIQSNYEFCDHLNTKGLTLPTKFLMPSYWKLQEMKDRFGQDRVQYLPPPIRLDEFKHAREINMIKSGKRELLHIVGTLAAHDRNGTLDLLEAMKKTKTDFNLTIRSQHELPRGYYSEDKRIKYVIENTEDVESMYVGYDALVIPRRYGGLCLTCNEALLSGIPVIMPDISPNNRLLPSKWLVPAHKTGDFMARTTIDVYGSDIDALAKKLDWVGEYDCEKIKTQAFQIGYDNFSDSNLREQYKALFE